MEERKESLDKLSLQMFEAVSKFKSVNRAFKRGHVSAYGHIYPKRPFNNRTVNKGSRPFNELKKIIYGQLRSKD